MLHRRTSRLLLANMTFATVAMASPVDLRTATQVASTVAGADRTVAAVFPHPATGEPVLFVARLEPAGFVVVAADDDLPPVIGYSFDSDCATEGPAASAVLSLLAADLGTRLAQVPRLPSKHLADRRAAWQRLLAGEGLLDTPKAEVWPPPGSTPTGGWVLTRWTQNAPYSDQCPMDPVTHQRSLAGCPAVAMAQVVNSHRNHHRTRFDDGDDYYHSYAGRTYWIDDAHATHGFPSFPELSASLDALEMRYAAGGAITDADAAALVFACGVAARQVFTSSASGTFGVDQARDAYLRFGEATMVLLDPADPQLHQRLAANMQQGLPAHLAVVDASVPPQYGHNLVVDGYDGGDGRFHLNFGWGGSYDGWYLIPDEVPYGLTVIEGVIVDIAFPLARDGFESGGLGGWSSAVP